jgi:hypothetical protein
VIAVKLKMKSIFSLTAIPWYYNKVNYFHV